MTRFQTPSFAQKARECFEKMEKKVVAKTFLNYT